MQTAAAATALSERPGWLLLVVLCLAVHRVTRLVTRDQFPLIAVPREWIDTRWDPPGGDTGAFKRSIAYLVGCDWCTSIWVSAGLTTFAMIFVGFTWPWWIMLWLTASSVTGLIAQREPD